MTLEKDQQIEEDKDIQTNEESFDQKVLEDFKNKKSWGKDKWKWNILSGFTLL